MILNKGNAVGVFNDLKFTNDSFKKANYIADSLININNVPQTVWIKQVAYILATIYHETAHTFKPVEEYGKGKGKLYGQYFDIDRSKYTNLNHLYYGRGFVQITWLSNYKKAKDKLGIDFVNHPEYALDFDNSIKITNIGMVEGWFTGKKLDTYINEKQTDYLNARRIINGTDRAEQIASIASAFLISLA